MKCPVCKEKVSMNIQALYLHRCSKCGKKFEESNKIYFSICNIACIIVGLLICSILNDMVAVIVKNNIITALVVLIIYIIIVHILQLLGLSIAHKFVK